MAEDKALPPGVLKMLEWKPERADCEKVTRVIVAKILLHRNHLEVFSGYDYEHCWMNEEEEVSKFMDIVRVRMLIHKHQLSIQRTQYSHEAEERDPKKLGKLYHALVLRNYNYEFWLYMGDKDASKIFVALKDWMLHTVEPAP